MEAFWFLPTHGDSRYLGTSGGARRVDHEYPKQVAIVADCLKCDGVLLPTGGCCEDAWIVASSLSPVTLEQRIFAAVRPGTISPLSARVAATFERLSGGRLLNVVAGGDSAGFEGDTLVASHDERYEIAAEFLSIWRDILERSRQQGGFDFEGKHRGSSGGRRLFPPLYIGGSSEAAPELAAQRLDVYLTRGEPPRVAARKISYGRRRAGALGRTLRIGRWLHMIVREGSEPAWRAADERVSKQDEATTERAQAALVSPTPRGSAAGESLRAAGTIASRSLGTCGLSRAWVGGGAGTDLRRTGNSCGTHAAARGFRHRHLRSLGLSAPRGMLPCRGAYLPAPEAQQDAGQHATRSSISRRASRWPLPSFRGPRKAERRDGHDVTA
jgi:alkanesulfonate monooxygenase